MFSIPIYIIRPVFCFLEEARKREAERSRNDYGAVSFSYDENASQPNGDESYANKGSSK